MYSETAVLICERVVHWKEAPFHPLCTVRVHTPASLQHTGTEKPVYVRVIVQFWATVQ